MAHLLDNPAWNALGGPDAKFRVTDGAIRRYDPEVAGFVGAETLAGFGGLAEVLGPGESAVVITTEPIPLPGLDLIASRPLFHMIAIEPRLQDVTLSLKPLGTEHVAEMMALVELTKPGPFFRRTIEFGGYLGIFDDGRLVGMAGERKHLDGFSEVSAVCTHPDYRGRGYAKQLVSAVTAGIVARGEMAFLTTFTDNAPAIATYEALGYRIRRPMHVMFAHRPAIAA